MSLHHLSWSQIYTEALIEQGNRSVADPDQAWILAEFVRYLGHPRSGAVDFDDMGPSWVAVRDAARAGTLTQNNKGAVEVTNRFGQLISFAAMGLSRQLGVQVAPVLSQRQRLLDTSFEPIFSIRTSGREVNRGHLSKSAR